MSKRTQALVRAISAAGGHAFYTGGWVRDKAMGIPTSGDLDIEVYGLSKEELEEVLKPWNPDHVGKSFGVFKLNGLHGIDVSLPRKDTQVDPKDHKAVIVTYDSKMSTKEACFRRDFTMNSMLFDPLQEKIIDHWGGLVDIKRGQIRMVSEHFGDDPLRALRAIKFMTRTGFSLEPKTAETVRKMNTSKLPAERIWGELSDMLAKGIYWIDALNTLVSSVTGKFWFPELVALHGLEQDPSWHPEGDVLTHTALVVQAASQMKIPKDKKVKFMLAALLHDLGKAKTTIHKDGHIKSPLHDRVSAELAEVLMTRLHVSKEIQKYVVPMVRNHMWAVSSMPHGKEAKVSDGKIRKLSTKVPSIDDLMDLAVADKMGTTDARLKTETLDHIESIRQRARKLKVLHAAPKPIIQGRHLIDFVTPGPQMGEILAWCYEQHLNGKVTSPEQGIALWCKHHNQKFVKVGFIPGDVRGLMLSSDATVAQVISAGLVPTVYNEVLVHPRHVKISSIGEDTYKSCSLSDVPRHMDRILILGVPTTPSMKWQEGLKELLGSLKTTD